MSVRRLASLVTAALLGGLVAPALAQTTLYRLHNEASTTAGLKQLRAAAPDAVATVLQSAALQGTAAGEKVIAQFNTATGVPGTAGRIPIGATISTTVWMRKTANVAAMVPRLKVRLDSASGALLCTATGTTALTTTLAAYTLTCTTSAVVTLTAASRLYVWAGVNLTTTSSTAFRAELGLEGTAGGNYDSTVTIPNALPAPTLTSLSPASGAVGGTVTITGSNFRDQRLNSTVTFFSNKTATVTSWSNTSIVATVPTGTTTGAVRVTVAGVASNTATFTVVPPPAITSLSPTSGAGGAPVTVTGTNFGSTQGTSTVKFNGVTATANAWSATQITTVVPAAATTGNVVVTVNGVASAGAAFVVQTPAAAPVLSPAGGTYAAGQLVTLTSSTPGATIYYTINGQDPTTADFPLANGGTVPVGTYTIKARAYATGSSPSAVSQAAYTRDSSACTYTVRPGALSLGGAAWTGQVAVTPSSEFCDWTAASSQPWLTLGAASGSGSRAFSVLTAANTSGANRTSTITIGGTVLPVVQNVVGTCTFSAAPSAVAAPATAGGGTINVTASDPSCAWLAASDVPWVTFSGASGVGSGSLSYSYTANAGPTARWSGLTVANQQVALTQASGTALTIAGGTAPPANALGWHREDVTVVFTCAGPGNISCPNPVTVTTDGIHDIEGLASNDLAQTASTTVPVRIDRVAPHVAVSFPRANSLVQPGPVTITGSVTDGLSEPVVVCGQALATVNGGGFACTLTVASGTTVVPISAVDAAGNTRTITASISTTDAIVTPPTNLRVSPQNVTIAVGQHWHFAMLDDLDRAPVDVAWTRTNPALSTLATTSDGQVELTGVATGITTLTASWRGLTASTTVTIVSANAFVAGTTIWSAPPLSPGAPIVDVLTGATTPAGERFLYAVERGATDRVRVFTSQGAERAAINTGGYVTQLSGDAFGGVVVAVEGSPLIRVDVGGVATPLPTCAGGGFAIHPDGALYCTSLTPTGAIRLSGVDIGLGGGRTVDLPLQPDGNPGGTGEPTVMPDGSVALPHVLNIGTVFEPRNVVRLLLSRPDGTTTSYSLMNENTPVYTGGFSPYKAIPDGQGGYFVAYDQNGPSVNYYGAMLAHLDSNGVVQNVAEVAGGQPGVSAATWFGWSGGGTSHGRLVMGPDGFGSDVVVATLNMFENGQFGVGAVDLTANGFPMSRSWTQSNSQWTYLSDERGFVVSLPNGIIGGPGTGWDLMTLTNPRPYRATSWLGGTVGGLVEMSGPSFLPAISQWPAPGGGRRGDNSAPRPIWIHFLPLENYNDPKMVPTPPIKPPEEVEEDIKSYINGSTKVPGTHLFRLRSQADPWNFADEVGYSENDAVAFFGHSTFTSAVGATGMVFFNNWALVKQGFPGPEGYPERTINISTIPSSARVILIANCDVRDLFKGMWNIGPGRALIYTRGTSDGKVNLAAASIAWGKMMQELSKKGTTVAQAVATTNNFLNTNFRPVGHPEHFEFAFDQGGDVKLVK